MPRAWGRSHIARAPFGFCGQKPHWAPAWAGWLLAFVNAWSARLAPPKKGGAAYFKAFKKELRTLYRM
ncbi:MAG TPA: hypothetical protein DCL49_00315 [Candidatus Omnitrophica bacterium]|nr:hypothetical protein [Candidatus Omnitrophota bacterium]